YLAYVTTKDGICNESLCLGANSSNNQLFNNDKINDEELPRIDSKTVWFNQCNSDNENIELIDNFQKQLVHSKSSTQKKFGVLQGRFYIQRNVIFDMTLEIKIKYKNKYSMVHTLNFPCPLYLLHFYDGIRHNTTCLMLYAKCRYNSHVQQFEFDISNISSAIINILNFINIFIPYSGPYLITERINEKMYTILVNGKAINVSTERLKPAYLPIEEADETVDTPTTSSQAPPVKPLRTYPGAKKRVCFAPILNTLGGGVYVATKRQSARQPHGNERAPNDQPIKTSDQWDRRT
ncbi:hypothetical protein X777_02177, partial [Ooceraea biroi]